MEGQFWVLEAN